MLIAVLLACAEPTGADDGCAVAVDPGTAAATVDGEPWTGGGATWRWAGESLQLNTVGAGSWWLSMVAQTTGDGTTLKAAVDAGVFPITVSLSEGGWATFYPDSGSSFSSEEGDGELVLVEATPTTVRGCFWFDASSGTDTVSVEAGELDADPAE